jgi:uncharacterized membrane protein YccC
MKVATLFHGTDARHGAQLAAAVVIAYLGSAAVGLPEGFWAVMSALIVTRPDTGATLAAGWDRVRGTLLGTLCGLGGVWLRHTGLGLPAATLVIVAVLAFASAGVPILRSAPITALIVLSSGGIAGHTPMQVATLRVAEIAIGVSVGLAISVALPASRAANKFGPECAKVLRQVAAQVGRVVAGPVRSADERDTASATMRAALRQLVLLGDSAGRESRFSWRRLLRRRAPEGAEGPSHRRIAQLVMRTSQDAALLGRIFESQAATEIDDPFWTQLREAACAALDSVASAFARQGRPDLSALRQLDAQLAQRRQAGPDDAALLLAGPMRWLLEDLRALGRIAAAG